MRAIALTENTENLELAWRATRSRYWRWTPGMIDPFGRTNTEAGWHTPPVARERIYAEPLAIRLPDLTHPATLGCLVALVREIWKDPFLYSSWGPDARRWEVLTVPSGKNECFPELIGQGATEAASWVAALENR